MKPTLLILAAGLGTRYGGLKQIDPIGPNGEIIIDYSIYDAINAGFGKLVFVIRRYFESAFKEKIGSKFDNLMETAYAYQELDACVDGFELPAPMLPAHQTQVQVPKDRDKPWGTGHAILVARDVIHEPFAVINADDHYGSSSFQIMARFLASPACAGVNLSPRKRGDLSCATQHQLTDEDRFSPNEMYSPEIRSQLVLGNDYAMVGYTLRDTLSECGPVCRGVCQCDEQMFLRTIAERRKVENTATGVRYFEDNGTERFLTGNEIVSMNLWGFQPSIFHHLKVRFRRFLEKRSDERNSELFIPTVVDELVEKEKATVKVLRTNDKWFGVTYRRDAATAARCIRQLIDQGLYPEKLWEQS